MTNPTIRHVSEMNFLTGLRLVTLFNKEGNTNQIKSPIIIFIADAIIKYIQF